MSSENTAKKFKLGPYLAYTATLSPVAGRGQSEGATRADAP
jgi:hypothetical protein